MSDFKTRLEKALDLFLEKEFENDFEDFLNLYSHKSKKKEDIVKCMCNMRNLFEYLDNMYDLDYDKEKRELIEELEGNKR